MHSEIDSTAHSYEANNISDQVKVLQQFFSPSLQPEPEIDKLYKIKIESKSIIFFLSLSIKSECLRKLLSFMLEKCEVDEKYATFLVN